MSEVPQVPLAPLPTYDPLKDKANDRTLTTHHRFNCNPWIIYFYNQSNALCAISSEIIDDLKFIINRTAGILVQRPDYGDLNVVATLLGIICELAMEIDWKSLNRNYYIKDFSYEAKAITSRVSYLQKIAKDIRSRTKTLSTHSEFIFENIETTLSEDDEYLYMMNDGSELRSVQTRHEPPIGVKVIWDNVSQQVELAAEAKLDNSKEGSCKLTTDRLRVRVLRFIMNYTRTLLDSSYAALKKIDAIIKSEIHLKPLSMCKKKSENALTPFEQNLVAEAKGRFRKELTDVFVLASYLNYHCEALEKFNKVLKKVTSNPKKRVEFPKRFLRVEICLEDTRMLGFWQHDTGNNDESRDEDEMPIMIQDRAEDTLEMAADMLTISSGCFKTIEKIFFLLRQCDWNVFDETVKQNRDFPKIKTKVNEVTPKFRSMKNSLSKSVKLMKTDKVLQQFFPDESLMAEFRINREKNPSNIWKAEGVQDKNSRWITLSEDFRVSYVNGEIIVKNSSGKHLAYTDLCLEEKMRLIYKLLEKLDIIAGYGKYFVKYALERVMYTKILVKRLRTRDQMGQSLETTIQNGANQINLLLELIEEMETLQKALV